MPEDSTVPKDKCRIYSKSNKFFLEYQKYSFVAESYLIKFNKEIIGFKESGLNIPNTLDHIFNTRISDGFIIVDELHKIMINNKTLVYSGIIQYE